MLGSAQAEALSYSAVKLFSKNSNLCHHAVTVPERHRQADRVTDDILWHITALCVASRGNKIRYLSRLSMSGIQCSKIIILQFFISRETARCRKIRYVRYRNLEWHRAAVVFPAIARLSCLITSR